MPLSITRPLAPRAVAINIKPRLHNILQSSALLSVLKRRYGEVEHFKNYRYNYHEPRPHICIAIFKDATSAEKLIRSSPLTFKVEIGGGVHGEGVVHCDLEEAKRKPGERADAIRDDLDEYQDEHEEDETWVREQQDLDAQRRRPSPSFSNSFEQAPEDARAGSSNWSSQSHSSPSEEFDKHNDYTIEDSRSVDEGFGGSLRQQTDRESIQGDTKSSDAPSTRPKDRIARLQDAYRLATEHDSATGKQGEATTEHTLDWGTARRDSGLGDAATAAGEEDPADTRRAGGKSNVERPSLAYNTPRSREDDIQTGSGQNGATEAPTVPPPQTNPTKSSDDIAQSNQDALWTSGTSALPHQPTGAGTWTGIRRGPSNEPTHIAREEVSPFQDGQSLASPSKAPRRQSSGPGQPTRRADSHRSSNSSSPRHPRQSPTQETPTTPLDPLLSSITRAPDIAFPLTKPKSKPASPSLPSDPTKKDAFTTILDSFYGPDDARPSGPTVWTPSRSPSRSRRKFSTTAALATTWPPQSPLQPKPGTILTFTVHATYSKTNFNEDVAHAPYSGFFKPVIRSAASRDLEQRVPLRGLADFEGRREGKPVRTVRWMEQRGKVKKSLRKVWEEGREMREGKEGRGEKEELMRGIRKDKVGKWGRGRT
ncbi:hypothetical protein C1H76_4801 [Elsinoe australis]|uniref:Uncharacterized protein n=1 Tax=Elsinoe australis TaxID=40998 RepID=A0A4U7B5P0_9PEZI|nr:hypothetical protein C1H76_4801 [Elsinoe australis]